MSKPHVISRPLQLDERYPCDLHRAVYVEQVNWPSALANVPQHVGFYSWICKKTITEHAKTPNSQEPICIWTVKSKKNA